MSFNPVMRKTRSQYAKANKSNPQEENNDGENLKKNISNDQKVSIAIGKNRKRKAESNETAVNNKRSAFGDLTNAIEKTLNWNTKNDLKKTKPPVSSNKQFSKAKSRVASSVSNNLKQQAEKLDKKAIQSNTTALVISKNLKTGPGQTVKPDVPFAERRQIQIIQHEELPEGVDDFDKSVSNDLYAMSDYAMDIFSYYKQREDQFVLKKYMSSQPDINKSMRAILVDWMVEIQESFELNHETLYLAVKLVDVYLSKVVITRDRLQLVGATAIFIACKFDERIPPFIDDFLYVCNDAYVRKELILMEIELLKTLKFDLGMPLSYRFLRRYARCAKVSMESLTFARYILESSLLDEDFIEVKGSLLACATLFLALHIKDDAKEWSKTLKYYSGYAFEDFYHFVQLLHQMLCQPPKDHLKTIRTKYSHKIFFEVAKIPIPDKIDI